MVELHGKGRIMEIILPPRLVGGEEINGSVGLANDGADDKMALVWVTEWDEMGYYAFGQIRGGTSILIVLPERQMFMPNQNAHITFYACHEEPGGEFQIEGTDYKIDDYRTC